MSQTEIFVAKEGSFVGSGSTRTHVELYISAGEDWSTTETDTSIEVDFSCFGMYYSIQPTLTSSSTATTRLEVTGQTTQTTTKTGSQSFNGGIEKSFIFSKTHSTQKITTKGTFTFSNFKDANGNTFSGTSTATGTFNIPPKTSYQITLNLNGGTGAATSATKWHGENLVFPAPTKDGYALAGWTDGTQTYDSEHPYTANAAATLTAVWTPTISAIYITDLTVKRATSAGVLSDEGTYALIEPAWRVEGAATGTITVAATMDSTPAYSDSETVTKSSTANVDSGDLANPPSFLASGAETNQRYTVNVTVSCGGKTATRSVVLPTAYFVMDVKAGGHGIAFGTPATTDYLFEVDNMDVKLGQDLSVGGNVYAATSTPLVPVGTILDYAGDTAPMGYLVCDGSAVSRTDYAALFAVIGTTWGSGDGSTTFNIPDFRGRTSIGSGTGTAPDATAHALGSGGGSETVTLSTTQIPSHNHGTNTDGEYFVTNSNSSASNRRFTSVTSGTNYTDTQNDASFHHRSGTGSTGGGGSHSNMTPYRTVTKIIRAI